MYNYNEARDAVPIAFVKLLVQLLLQGITHMHSINLQRGNPICHPFHNLKFK